MNVTLMVAHFFCHINNMAKHYEFVLIYLLMIRRKNWRNIQFTYNLHVQLMMINMRKLCYIMTLIMIFQINRINILCGNWNKPLIIRYHLLYITLTTKDFSIMLWLNGRLGRLPQSCSPSFQYSILSHVLCMLMIIKCLKNKYGDVYDKFLNT